MRSLVIAALLGVAFVATPAQAKPTKEQMRADVRKMATQTLNRLYKVQPSAKQAVQNAAGYAVFSNFGMKIFVAGGGSGEGIAVDNRSGKETFMKMAEVQAGLGFGVKKFRVIFVFDNSKVLDDFVNQGWEFGGQATASAKVEGKGTAYQGAMSAAPGVWMYQLTDQGLAAEVTAKGTKYYKDDALN